jgi:hypothetical protein
MRRRGALTYSLQFASLLDNYEDDVYHEAAEWIVPCAPAIN